MPLAVYVYGVLSRSERPSISTAGVEEAEVGVVDHGDLAALTSPLKGEALVAARDVRAHWRVLEDAFNQVTVLPLRFGTVLENQDAVREQLLEPNAEYLGEMLAAMRGRVQLNVRGRYEEENLLREIVLRSPEVASLREQLRGVPDDDPRTYGQRVRLGELVAEQVARRREADTRLAFDTLAPLAVATREEPLRGEREVFNLAFLVDRKSEGAFGTAVGALRQKLAERIAVHYVGPLAPYSFVDGDLTVGSAAWA